MGIVNGIKICSENNICILKVGMLLSRLSFILYAVLKAVFKPSERRFLFVPGNTFIRLKSEYGPSTAILGHCMDVV